MTPDDPWGMPAAREVLAPNAPRERWLEARRQGIGGSDIPLLLGVANPNHGSEFGLWQEKTGRATDNGPTHAMIRGTWLEPNLAEQFTAQTGIRVREFGLCRNLAEPILQYSPDRFSADGGIVEIKSIGEYAKIRHEWRGGGVAKAAYAQGQFGLLVTGRYPLWLVAYEIDTAPVIRGPFAPDRELHDRMRAIARQWWDRYVLTDSPPPVDLAKITDEEIAARWPVDVGDAIEAPYPALVEYMLDERAQVHEQETAAAKRKKEIDAALKVMIGDYTALTMNGDPVVTYRETDGGPHVAPEMEWEEPEMWARYVRRAHYRRINFVKKKGNGS
jgi:putative phage-type endonuclease